MIVIIQVYINWGKLLGKQLVWPYCPIHPINNAKATSSFKHNPLLVSSNVKLKITWVKPPPNFLPHHVVPNALKIKTIFEVVRF